MLSMTYCYEFRQRRAPKNKWNCLLVVINMAHNRWVYKSNEMLKSWAHKCGAAKYTPQSTSDVNCNVNWSMPLTVIKTEAGYEWRSYALVQVLQDQDLRDLVRDKSLIRQLLKYGSEFICISKDMNSQTHAYLFYKDQTDDLWLMSDSEEPKPQLFE